MANSCATGHVVSLRRPSIHHDLSTAQPRSRVKGHTACLKALVGAVGHACYYRVGCMFQTQTRTCATNTSLCVHFRPCIVTLAPGHRPVL
jgi:hypothetical protein